MNVIQRAIEAALSLVGGLVGGLVVVAFLAVYWGGLLLIPLVIIGLALRIVLGVAGIL